MFDVLDMFLNGATEYDNNNSEQADNLHKLLFMLNITVILCHFMETISCHISITSLRLGDIYEQ